MTDSQNFEKKSEHSFEARFKSFLIGGNFSIYKKCNTLGFLIVVMHVYKFFGKNP